MYVITTKKAISFSSDDNKLSGNMYLPQKSTKGVLILHGGGKATKERFIEIQELLAASDIASFAFDFRGVGDSEGKFEDGSLDNRLSDAVTALHKFSKYIASNHIFVMGTSMGGHVAARLAEKEPRIAGLMLLYAAAYGKDAEDKPLNDAFTQAIRKDHNWVNSPAFAALAAYQGNVLIAYGEHDAIVPKDVQQTYQKLVKNKGTFLILPKAAHLLLSPKNAQETQAKQKLYTAILSFINNNTNLLL